MPVITISRDYGSGGERIGWKIAQALGLSYFDKELLSDVARAANLTEEEIGQLDERAQSGLRNFLKKLFNPNSALFMELPHYYPAGFPMDPSLFSAENQTPPKSVTTPDADQVMAFFREVIENLWKRDNVVIIGRGGQKILANKPNTVHVRFIGLVEERCKTVMAEENLSADEALKKLKRIDAQRIAYFKHYHEGSLENPKLYHLVVNTSFVPSEQAVQAVVALVEKKT